MIPLTTEHLASYIGGQMEIQNQGEGYLFRGEVKTIVVVGGELKVEFTWLAKAEGFPPVPSKWLKADRLHYTANLELYGMSYIGPSADGGGTWTCLTSQIVGETVGLFPPDGSKLDPAKVEGLEVQSTGLSQESGQQEGSGLAPRETH